MLVTSRRSLILGLTSLIAAPALVRASSLMDLKGYNMDPWVIAVRNVSHGLEEDLKWIKWRKSDFNFPSVTRGYNLFDYIKANINILEYAKMRQSEVLPNISYESSHATKEV